MVNLYMSYGRLATLSQVLCRRGSSIRQCYLIKECVIAALKVHFAVRYHNVKASYSSWYSLNDLQNVNTTSHQSHLAGPQQCHTKGWKLLCLQQPLATRTDGELDTTRVASAASQQLAGIVVVRG